MIRWSSWAPDSGLYYYGARWYDAALARFVSPDTVMPDQGNPQHFNRFSYTANNPLRYIDPSGHNIEPQPPPPEPPPPPPPPPPATSVSWEVDPPTHDSPFADLLSEVSFDLGVAATIVSWLGVPVEMTGTPLAYQPLNAWETILGIGSWACTGVADFLYGNTSIGSDEAGYYQVTIGQDTLVATATMVVGTLDLEAIGDTVINLASTAYTGLRNEGAIPNGRLVIRSAGSYGGY